MSKKVWVIIGIVLIVVFVNLSSNETSTNTTSTTSTSSTESSEVVTESNNSNDNITKEVSKKWTTVCELRGSANKSSDTFRLNGGKVRITYNFSGGDMIVGTIYVLKEGTDLMVSGGIPEVMVSQGTEDSTIIRKASGEYYIQINSVNTEYSIKVEEKK